MLSITLEPGEYITIGGSTVVKVSKLANGRCFLAVEADRSLPIVRSAVLERSGMPAPRCITSQPPRKKPRYKSDAVFCWNDDRERAVRMIQKVADRLEQGGSKDAAKILRIQVDQLLPDMWEENLAKQ
ncbi:MAG: carbon storage regulator [Lawsonibacter sp.]|nr:carbon storage regulator [Lawsonibacter sp.]